MIRASAGSGKTHQLTNRYLSLLAAGAAPDTILATTFTRKAAGEIVDRVLERLAMAAGDAAAATELAEQVGQVGFGPRDWTRLLRTLLANLHRVRIGTLDSFTIALADSFSLELGLPAGWSICEQADDDALHQAALERLLEYHPEHIGRLLPLLTKGESQRSVQKQLHEVIHEHYEKIYLGSERSTWENLQVPPAVAPADRTAALNQLRAFDFSACNKHFVNARDNDIRKFETEQWVSFLGSGLAAKVGAGETTYQRKQIPEAAQTLYRSLVQHARSQVLEKLAQQTRATWDLLDRFHRELWTLKQASGALRFGEVTQVLVDVLQRQALPAEALAFRLDGAIEHLLLDEFQDTALAQWRVLEPIARAIAQAKAGPRRSFFCVGDVKQAIYGWRGGMAGIFDTLHNSLSQVQERELSESYRSAQPIIDVVNQVFSKLRLVQAGENKQEGLDGWSKRFQQHRTVKKETVGYVCLQTGPAQAEGQKIANQRPDHCKYVAQSIRDLHKQVPACSIGVLCWKNPTVACMIYELRQLGVDASEEGGNQLTDSPAVELIMSLLTLADHPGHSIAWFHLLNSALQEHLGTHVDTVARQLRRELLADGYGRFVQRWATRLAGICGHRDLRRLQQLVEMAYAFAPRSTLRPADFVAWVREPRQPDPSRANVRVMTIHGAKGLQFDIVVLPELDVGLVGQPPAFVVGRDPKTLEVNRVCRYADEAVQKLLEQDDQLAFQQDWQQRVEESLSVLYVAMTRAVNALQMVIPGPRDGKSNRKDAWYNLLLQTLTPKTPWTEKSLLFEHGDANWVKHMPTAAPDAVASEYQRPKSLTFGTSQAERRRGLEHVAPSRREGQAQVALDHLFHPAPGTGTAVGTLFHAWFETIGWLDDGVPTDDALRATAQKLLVSMPPETRRELDRLLADFRGWLQNPQIGCVLRRSAYAGNSQPGFPTVLARMWTKTMVPQQVERERRFLIRDGTKFLSGSLDRIVWLGDGERTLAADVIDFKTDAIPPSDQAALAARTEHYRPQLEAYRQAVARLAPLPAERVAARLVFTYAGCIQEV
jgi:ATP-dependent exoDNAse (exonuclease V) beta subunit